MKKILVSLLFAIPAVASAQSVFTVETEGRNTLSPWKIRLLPLPMSSLLS